MNWILEIVLICSLFLSIDCLNNSQILKLGLSNESN
jgi:hypothetical protein